MADNRKYYYLTQQENIIDSDSKKNRPKPEFRK